MFGIIESFQKVVNNIIDARNRKRLKNKDFTWICSNCTAGIMSHKLGLKFNTPTVNLYMKDEDFVTAMENFDEFFAGEIIEDKNAPQQYPVGIGHKGVRIHFMHYPDFETAIKKWNERKQRINKENMTVWLANFNDRLHGQDISLIQRFNQLPFKNKVLFTSHKIDHPNVVSLKKYDKINIIGNIWLNYTAWGKRYVDQFDYISHFNSLKS